jgi:hypothetical protein
LHPEIERELREQVDLSEKWGLQRGTPVWIRFFVRCDSFLQRDMLLHELADCRPCDAQAEYDRAHAPLGFRRTRESALIEGQTAPFPFDEEAVRRRLERIHRVVESAGGRIPFTWHLGEPTPPRWRPSQPARH